MYNVVTMGALIFRIISVDRIITGRWQKAFQKEGWTALINESCLPGEEAGGNCAEMTLIEIGVPGCKTPDDLRLMLKTRHPVSVLVFGDQQKTSNTQISAFLGAGADDFIYKNLDERVLVAKVKAHMRRIMPAITEALLKVTSREGDIAVDGGRRTVRITAKSGKYTELSNFTQKEFDILLVLLRHEQNVVPRELILEKVWGTASANVYPVCIDKHVESLRKKLGLYGKRIKTIYGSGYVFTGETK